jgi:DNA sulfur modification protein DndD
MKLSRVELSNWGVYQGRHDIELDVPDSSPMVIIYGENATGKTTFANAIRWAFYGGDVERGGFDPAPYLSIYKDRGYSQLEFSVSLLIYIGESSYEVKRRAQATRDGRTEHGFKISDEIAELVINNEPTPAAVVQTGIRRLLPSDLADFFLFDGEELQKIDRALSGRHQTSVVKDRISDLLGLPVLEDFLKIVNQEDDFILKRIRTDERTAKSNQKLQDELDQINAQIGVFLGEQSRLQEQHRTESQRLEKIRQSMTDSHDLRVTATRLTDVESDLKDQRSQLIESTEELCELHDLHWYLPVAEMLLKRGELQDESASKRSEFDRDRWDAESRLETLKRLSSNGICPSCGQECAGNNPGWELEIKTLEEKITNIPDSSAFVAFDRVLSTWCQEIFVGEETCIRESSRNADLRLSINRLEGDKRRLESTLRGKTALEIQSLVSEYDDTQALLAEIEEEIANTRQNLNKVEERRDEISKQIVNSSGVSPLHRARHDILEQLKTIVSSSVEEFRERIRRDVEECASDFYVEMETDPFVVGLSISKDYELRILSGNAQDPTIRSHGSAGQTLSSVYALIGALIKVSGNPCFWLVDTPVSRADTKRTPAIWRWLTNQGRQVIVLPHSGELTSKEANQLFGNRLGRELEIVRTDSDLSSTIRQYHRI